IGPGEGGFAGVPGSHKSNFPLPDDFRYFRTTGPWLQQVPIRAGSALIFSEALTHGTLPWSAEHERRSLLYKYCPGYMSWSTKYPVTSDAPEADFTPRQQRILESPYYEPGERAPVVDGND
ncbi:MAG TPA: phytanoyl-CoA dioxygenase family protein, partial [Gaiellaceae bacterium]|nr:phytanoyl-CoA dioxygenase family protein [Gaiellaceae bacterium]